MNADETIRAAAYLMSTRMDGASINDSYVAAYSLLFAYLYPGEEMPTERASVPAVDPSRSTPASVPSVPTREQRTKFDYLLNAFEAASQSNNPAANNYAAKRVALFAYVRDLEIRLDALTAEHEASARDAERFRWLEEQDAEVRREDNEVCSATVQSNRDYRLSGYGDTIADAIDAARAATREEGR